MDLAAVAADIVASNDATAARRGVHINASLEPASIAGSPLLIERLVANLIDNAIRHNDPDGQVDVATRSDGGEPILTVANTGPVVPQDEVERLLEPFQRINGDRSTHPHGHGLGLSIGLRRVPVGLDRSARPEPPPAAFAGLRGQLLWLGMMNGLRLEDGLGVIVELRLTAGAAE